MALFIVSNITHYITEHINYLLFTVGIILLIIFFVILFRRVRRKTLERLLEIRTDADLALSFKDCEKHMKALALQHKVIKYQKQNAVLRDLNQISFLYLNIIRSQLENASPKIISLIPGARWLFDNSYLLFRELRKTDDFRFSKMLLPVLSGEIYKNIPRIYIIAREMVVISGKHLREENISAMIRAYQSEEPLTSAELWILLDMIKLCLMQNTICAARDILAVIQTKTEADKFIQENMFKQSDKFDIQSFLVSKPKKENLADSIFLSHVLYCLKNMSVEESVITKLMEQWTSNFESPRNIILKESRFEANLESVIRALIVSLREANNINGEELFERLSPIEKILSSDPAGIYEKMDFETRNQYRLVVEKLARRFKISELETAQKALQIAESPPSSNTINCPNHVGTYLITKEIYLLKSALAGKPNTGAAHKGNAVKMLYSFSITLSSAIILGIFVYAILHAGYLLNQTGSILFLLIIFFPILGIAVEITNAFFTNIMPAQVLPSLDFLKEIPDECKTFVVMPVILSSGEQARQYVTRLEKYYFANMQSNLYFALLADLTDAPSRIMPQDKEILQAVNKAINLLNNKYHSSSPRFMLFFRYRKWNESEGCWMGWERKRGKLEEFNAMLCGDENTTFSLMQGDCSVLSTFRYVITLDADTDLIRDSAARLIGTIAHPLNKPIIDPQTNKIKEGYAIIQSEIRNHIFDAGSCLFSRTFAGQQGLDPYSNIIADIYQDTFGEGIFVGKGIYDLHAIHRILNKAFPDNSVLSHDLLESCYARCAFSSSIKLMDTYPSSVFSYTKREHRWIRGDWQLLPWLFGRGHINGISRWKIFDNLRRSLIPFCRLTAILLNALFFPDMFYLWIPVVFFSDAYHFVMTVIKTLIERARHPHYKIALLGLDNILLNIAKQACFGFILIPYRACVALDAIARTLFRLAISHKHLLQWQTMESHDVSNQKSLSVYYASMWAVLFPVLAAVTIGIFAHIPIVTGICLFFSVLWGLSPCFAFLLSRTSSLSVITKMTDMEKTLLRLIARRTWQFFKDFTTPKNNWLCPDNYQAAPSPKISDKTSPTNIGLQLLSFLSARDLGYSGLLTFLENCENILYTIAVLPKWRGHLYNWYNVQTMEILAPRYISTVDSGNFISYMITLKNALLSFLNEPVFSVSAIQGIKDTLLLANVDIPFSDEYATVSDFIQAVHTVLETLNQSTQNNWEDEKYKQELKELCAQYLLDAEMFGAPALEFSNQYTLKQLASSEHAESMEVIKRIKGIARTLHHMEKEANFKALFDYRRLLFHIGYHESSKTLDSSYYDLMASESSLTSLLAIAKGNAPKKHWFYLSRPLTIVRGIPAFVSWSGTMFEYLMPNLVMKEYPRTVFSQTAKAAVIEQIRYAKKMKMPWGMSESQYFRFDVDSNYQYKAFGVPKLKLQPSSRTSLVIAPYATFLAMHIKPRAAIKNMQNMHEKGAEGEYGFFEALDFNSPDSQTMQNHSVIRSFMAHHQGMILVSINNLFNNNIMQDRFHSEPMIRATEILLEEMRGSEVIPVESKGYSVQIKQPDIPDEPIESRYIMGTKHYYPTAHWLSNRQYSLLLTADGDGFSRYEDIMINRWRSDKYASAGNYIYLRDMSTKKYWSTTFKPTLIEPDNYQVEFAHHKVEYKRQDGDIETQMAVTISPAQNYELRRVTLINSGNTKRVIELTSYIEVVFDQFLSELYHPAFSKLFMESEYVQEDNMLIIKKRKKMRKETQPFLMHMVKTNAAVTRNVEYQTDRIRFLGRNNTSENPSAILESLPLGNRAGFSVDPILSLRVSISVPSGQAATVTFITGVFNTREETTNLSADLSELFSINHVFEQFRLNSELEMKYLSINSQHINAYQDLVGPIFYSFKPFRGPEECIERNWKNQSLLWRFGISGDNPILLLEVNSIDEAGIVKDVLRAYEYFRINQMNIDLILLNKEPEGYMQDLDNMLAEMISSLKVYNENISKPSLFILRKNQMESKELDLLFSVACIVFSESTGIYFSKIREELKETHRIRLLSAQTNNFPQKPYITETAPIEFETNIEYFNSFGGFANNATEYEIRLDMHHKPPKPWINVIANDRLGFQISEVGAGYTWSINSRENKLTVWSNDPVTDPVSEAIYIKDTASGKTYLPAPLGNFMQGGYTVRHGFGYSVFENKEKDLQQQMTVFVDKEEPVRLWKLSLTNTMDTPRQLDITLYIGWVLGVDRELTAPYIVTEYNPAIRCLTAKSVYNYQFRNYYAFAFSSEQIESYTGDREEFFGKYGSVNHPEGIHQPLSNKTGAGLDPCGVIRVSVTIEPQATKDVIFGLGQSDDITEIEKICYKYRNTAQADQSLEVIHRYWNRVTQCVTVSSCNRSLDILANGWLLYQTISCRIKARAAFYQCGGAYGFRDQLQDMLALLDVEPSTVKKQILLSCSRQFEEGDVQHWWHTPVGVGVRTRITDDLLWLPYVAAAYISHTGDFSILDEEVPYINGPALRADEHEAMSIPVVSDKVSSVYDHCIQAIRHAQFGEHGLPLMGGGDWNDGMNRVGINGTGESVWLGWFLYSVFMSFLPLCRLRNDEGLAYEFEQKAVTLAENLENNAWDGEWYMRAFYDDGQKLGSIDNDECRIDSISQSWSVISGAAAHDRTLQALYSARRYLVNPREGVSLLLTPPFDKTPNDPGYIKDYFPGIRENGGQYTHAAIWLAIAHMMVKECNQGNDLINMLNPVLATLSQQGAMKYEKEPYVMSADIAMGGVYSGCAGWSWYTGSASWMYQAILRWFLGIRREGNKIVIDPAVPVSYGDYTVKYHFGNSLYVITVRGGFRAECNTRIIIVDNIERLGNSFKLIDDSSTHFVLFYTSEETRYGQFPNA